MKVGIYSKWIETLGGGEKVATVMAEILSKHGFETEILTTFKTDKAKIERKMNVDLSKVKLVSLEERSYDKILPKTANYDLFINTSFLDHQPTASKKSLYYILFPTPINRTFLGFIKYETILPLLRKYLIIPTVSSGLNNIGDVISRAGKWLDENNTIILSNPPKKFAICFRIYSETITLKSLNLIEIDSSNTEMKLIDKKMDHNTSTLVYKFLVSTRSSSSAVINIKVDKQAKKMGVALVSLTVNDFRFFLWNVLKRYLPRYEMALYGSQEYKPAGGLDTYDLFLADSVYTQKWTYNYWRKNADVLYPPIDVENFKSSKNKKNIILNVGRFFVGGHSKRQDILITAFKEMVDKKMVDKSWELHLVGGITTGWEHSNFVKNLQEEAKGYPIIFHFGIDFNDLKDLYAKAKIYWHAAGYGQNELRNPIGFEHFGITVIEAMSTGCVPIVYKGGGLSETVGIKKQLLWKKIHKLEEITYSVIQNKQQLKQLSGFFVKESQKYSRNNFEIQFMNEVNKLLVKIDDEK